MDRLENFYGWARSLQAHDIPKDVLMKSRLQFLNMLAAAMEGLRSEYMGGEPADPLFGLATAGMIHDFDDFLFYGHTGHSSVMVPLVLGAAADLPLGDALAAQTAANEIAGRFGGCLLMGPHNGQMWSSIHIPSTLAAAGRVLDLDPGFLARVTAAALSHAPFVIPASFLSSEAKFFTASIPVRMSLELLRNMKSGPYRSKPAPLFDSTGGFFSAFSYIPFKRFFSDPGETWLSSGLLYKKFPGCAYLQAGVDGALKIDVYPEEIEKITVRVDPLAMAMEAWSRRCSNPQTPFTVQAGFSIRKSIGAALVSGEFTCDTLSETWLRENGQALDRMAGRISVVPDLRKLAGMAGRAFDSILLPAAGLKPVDGAPPPFDELKTTIEIRMQSGRGLRVEGKFPAHDAGRLKSAGAMVTAKYVSAHEKYDPGTDPGAVIEAVLEKPDAGVREIIKKSLGKKWLDKILSMGYDVMKKG
ncbi:MAG: hypothetical protein ABIJ56_15320 [Pseudomonadota bacterium]